MDKQVRVGHKFHVYFHLDVAAEKVAEATPVGMWNSEQGLCSVLLKLHPDSGPAAAKTPVGGTTTN